MKKTKQIIQLAQNSTKPYKGIILLDDLIIQLTNARILNSQIERQRKNS